MWKKIWKWANRIGLLLGWALFAVCLYAIYKNVERRAATADCLSACRAEYETSQDG